MLKKIEQAQQQWGGSNQLIDTWLNKRQELIVNYCQIAGIPPFEENAQQLPQVQDITEFCNRLVDYVSTGHFEVYREVVSQCEVHGKQSLHHAEQLLPQITDSTQLTLEFTDKYAESNQEGWAHLDDHLSKLIQSLEQRFELEDQLLSNLHEKHSQPVE
ncbi:sigma D regulator [Psychrobium sp. 1_MG-2023]|uniref:sigma D regulator n=1 Tax=Psychrobium sp. 1_MG-2023 TaxID=3062624 RepID=UPI000C32FB0E|nr:sigma D regulator [Psychrobium sp. 1_MG-2023]MDP2560808.1 sigma D regulator [Psychrobium sp. 1_MG-2023]PKF56684.1 sigma D regulator [Alteromonadales bacterium alter-6D02]